jgi:hypothetical protein
MFISEKYNRRKSKQNLYLPGLKLWPRGKFVNIDEPVFNTVTNSN